MANAVTTVSVLKGYTTSFGSRGACVLQISWNAGQYIAGGLQINRQSAGLRGIDAVCGGGMISTGGTFRCFAQMLALGSPLLFKVRLIVNSTGLEVAGGAALTAESVAMLVIGG